MGIQEFPQVEANATLAQVREILAETNQLLDFVINGKLDSRNIREIAGYLVGLTEFKHKSGLVGLNGADPLDPDAIRIWAGFADMLTAPFRVQQNGYMYSTRGFIGGWDIGTDRLSGTGTIEGGTIIGSEIMTTLAGVYPRASMSTINELFTAEQSADEFIKMAANYLGSVALLINSSTVSGVIGPSINDLLITTFFNNGNIQISSGQDLLLYSSGLKKIESWSKLYSNGNTQTLQQALDAKQDDITSGDITIIGGAATLNSGIPATKIASGVVDNTEFQYLNGVTSSIQPQLDGKASKTLPSWNAPTLSNSWVNFGSPYSTAGYYKDDMSIVRLKGVIKNGTGVPGTTLFTLPTGSRPSEDLVRSTASNNAGVLTPVVLEISSAGVVKIGAFSSGTTWLTLDDISFRV